MSILGAISKAKSKFHEQKLKVRSRKLSRESQKLERRKNERIYQEGMADLKTAQTREESRIAKAKAARGPNIIEKIGAQSRKVGKGKNKMGAGMKGAALAKGNKYQLGGGPKTGGGAGPNWGSVGGSGGPSWSNVGPPTMRQGRRKKKLWG